MVKASFNRLFKLEMEDDNPDLFYNVPSMGGNEEIKFSDYDSNPSKDVVMEEISCTSRMTLPLMTLSRRHGGENHTKISSDENSTEKSRRRNSKVNFSNILIREYDIVIGDHPCCTMGCPLSLGWEYSDRKAVTTIDEYEANRPPRRSRNNLKT